MRSASSGNGEARGHLFTLTCEAERIQLGLVLQGSPFFRSLQYEAPCLGSDGLRLSGPFPTCTIQNFCKLSTHPMCSWRCYDICQEKCAEQPASLLLQFKRPRWSRCVVLYASTRTC